MTAPLTFAELDGLIAGACGCGLDHAEDGTGECDVPRLIDEIRRLHAEADAQRHEERQQREVMFKDLWTAMGHPDCGIRKWRGVLDAIEGMRDALRKALPALKRAEWGVHNAAENVVCSWGCEHPGSHWKDQEEHGPECLGVEAIKVVQDAIGGDR